MSLGRSHEGLRTAVRAHYIGPARRRGGVDGVGPGGTVGRSSIPLVAAPLSLLAGVFSLVLVGLIGEWFVHRYAMYRGRRFPLFRLATELHHRAHHCQHLTPETARGRLLDPITSS